MSDYLDIYPGITASDARYISVDYEAPAAGPSGPGVTSLSSPTASRWSGAQSRTITGAGFTNPMQAKVDGVNVATTFVNSTTLTIAVPNTVMWFNGAKSVTVDTASGSATLTVQYGSDIFAHSHPDAGVAISTGISVQNWAPGTGLAADANKTLNQLTGTAQFTRVVGGVNGKTRMRASAANSQRMVSGTWSPAPTQPRIRFTVILYTSRTTSPCYVDTSSGSAMFAQLAANGSLNGFAGTFVASGFTLVDNTVQLLGIEYNGATSNVYVNKKSPSGSGSMGTNSAIGTTLGSRASGSALFDGDIYEHLEAIPSATLLAEYSDYCAAEYGITVAP